MEDKKEIYKAILDVYKAVGYVTKKGTVEGGKLNYKFTSEADLIGALRPAMIDAGIISYPLDIEIIHDGQYVADKGNYKVYHNNIRCKVGFRFVHVESGQHIDVYSIGSGNDPGDKHPYKALTGAMKYALRQLFLIETGNDPDKDPSEPAVVPDAPAPVAPVAPIVHKAVAEDTFDYTDKAVEIIAGIHTCANKEDYDRFVAAYKRKYGAIYDNKGGKELEDICKVIAEKKEQFNERKDSS